MMRGWCLTLSMVAIVVSGAVARAQSRGTTSMGGLSAGSYSGGSGYSGSSYGATSGSSGMFGARSFGSSVTAGNRSFGGTARGGVAGATQRADNTIGQVGSGDRFVRGNRQGAQFVGSDATDLGRFVGALTGANGATNAGLGLRGGQQQSDVNRGGSTSMGNQMQKRYRTVRSVAFDHPQPGPFLVTTTLATRFQVNPTLQKMGPIAVEVQGRTAILRGEVATAHDRVIAEKLALLEAGISDVQNELTVKSPAVPQAAPPAAPASPAVPGAPSTSPAVPQAPQP
jgi:hypothetical protein